MPASVNRAPSADGRHPVEGFEDARFSQALALRRPKLLLISRTAGSRRTCWTLCAWPSSTSTAARSAQVKLDDYQVVILNN